MFFLSLSCDLTAGVGYGVGQGAGLRTEYGVGRGRDRGRDMVLVKPGVTLMFGMHDPRADVLGPCLCLD